MADYTPFPLAPWYERPAVSAPKRTHKIMAAGPADADSVSSGMMSVDQILGLLSANDVKPFADPLTKRETKTANYAATVDDNGKIFAFTVTGRTLTMPLAASAAGIADGYMLVVSAQVGALTIARSGTTDTIVGATSITLNQGETAILYLDADGTGWRASISPPYNTVARIDVANVFSQRQHWAKGTNIASASSIALPTNGNFFDVTGTATITAISTVTQAGTRIVLRATGAWTLQHNSATMIIPRAENLVVSSGDIIELMSLGSGNYLVVYVTRADGSPLVSNPDTKAWVNFNGTGTVSIRASKNVSSITDNGTGDYTVNFTSPLIDGNYALSGAASAEGASLPRFLVISEAASPTAAACRIGTHGPSGSKADCSVVTAVFSR